jgi:hypothetical protein
MTDTLPLPDRRRADDAFNRLASRTSSSSAKQSLGDAPARRWNWCAHKLARGTIASPPPAVRKRVFNLIRSLVAEG